MGVLPGPSPGLRSPPKGFNLMGHACLVLHVFQHVPPYFARDPRPNGLWSANRCKVGGPPTKMQVGQGARSANTREGPPREPTGSQAVFRNQVPLSDAACVCQLKRFIEGIGHRAAVPPRREAPEIMKCCPGTTGFRGPRGGIQKEATQPTRATPTPHSQGHVGH